MQITASSVDGDSGKGGAGGKGGKDGDAKKLNLTKKPLFGSCTTRGCMHNYHWSTQEIIKNNNRRPDGRNGRDGINGHNIYKPKKANGIDSSTWPHIINEYKIYQREEINNRFHKFHIRSFLDLLNNKNDVRKLYGILDLLEEFLSLEDQVPTLGNQIDFSPFYSSLMERILAYAESGKNIKNEEKKVLNYLYTAAMGRMYNSKDNSDKILIIDIREHLNIIESNIKKLQHLQTTNNKVEIINEYKDNYKSNIDKKIEEAQSLIKNQLKTEMDKINPSIDIQIKSLVEETISLQDQAKEDLKKLAKQKQDLQSAMVIKGIFNCLKIVGGVANLMGPAGIAIGTVINGVSTIAEPLALDKENKNLNVPNIVNKVGKTLTDLKGNIEAVRLEKVNRLEKLLNNISAEIKKNDQLGDLGFKVGNITEKIKGIKERKLNFMKVFDLEKELKDSIKYKIDNLREIKNKDKKSLGAAEVMDKFFEVMKLGSVFSDIYEQHKNDKKQMDIITKAMEEKSAEMVMLREYEKSIYDTIAPMLQNMEDGMKNIRAALGAKSRAGLDFTKWQVQSGLKDMKVQIQKITEGKAAKEGLSSIIEKLSEVMTTFIKIYDRIQAYHDQENLANYIADISSVGSTNIIIKNQKYVNAINRLEFVISGNVVIELYKSAMEALKQWVFPLKYLHLEEFMLPVSLNLEKNMENLVQSAILKIGAIRDKIKLYDTYITKGDQVLQCEEFTSRYLSSQPFFVWKNEENRESISSLLSGETVLLNADIKESPSDKEAIKFVEMEFEFKTKNETAQSHFSGLLLGFDMKATHLGNSYYIHDGEIYVFSSDSAKFNYSYQKNDEGMPIRANDAYLLLKQGDIFLSPYTFWEVTLVKKTNKYSFQDLSKYQNETNIELSGFGSYVFVSPRNQNSILKPSSLDDPQRSSSRGCKRTKYRSRRSVKGIAVDFDFMTNDALKGISSPISLFYNFLKNNFMTNFVISLNIPFFGGKTLTINECSELPDEYIQTRKIDSTVASNHFISDTDGKSRAINKVKAGIEPKSDTFIDIKGPHNDSCLKSFLLSDQILESTIFPIQTPDLNCSLLLADLVTRTINRNKYPSSVDECLLSPREVVLKRLSNGIVRNESDLKQMLHRHLSEKEVKRPSSWFSIVKEYAKSMLQIRRFEENSDNDLFVEDLRKLFSEKEI